MIFVLDYSYKLLISNKLVTCDDKQLISEKKGQEVTLAKCKKLCNKEIDCNFFFVNGAFIDTIVRRCALYRSCEAKQNLLVSGSTFQKRRGNYSKFELY